MYLIVRYIDGRLAVGLDIIVESAVEEMQLSRKGQIKARHILMGALDREHDIALWIEFEPTDNAAGKPDQGRAVIKKNGGIQRLHFAGHEMKVPLRTHIIVVGGAYYFITSMLKAILSVLAGRTCRLSAHGHFDISAVAAPFIEW